MAEPSLRITEIFHSLQGEARTSGLPTVFVRLTGCPLRCGYCDSEYAFYGGEKQSLAGILEAIKQYSAQYVCVTGGEPLAQRECHALLRLICDAGYQVSLETSGAMDVGAVDDRVSIVMDLKTPGSGEAAKNRFQNIGFLQAKDQIKFVICDRVDYEWARFKVEELKLHERVGDIYFSPAYGQLNPTKLADWILQDGIKVRLQLQLHKLLWGDVPGV